MGKAVANRTYKRSQVEWALWRALSGQKAIPDEPVPTFLTRVKRVLEGDRRGEPIEGIDAPAAPFAFASAEPDGQGVDAAFTRFDAFCLALALDLVDAGYKPSEVIVLIRLVRDELEARFEAIIKDPPAGGRQRQSARPGRPFYVEKGNRWDDARVFMVVRKVELKELYLSLNPKRDAPLFIEPVFCRGIDKLNDALQGMGHATRFRQALVLELAYLAADLTRLLEAAPITRRGPPGTRHAEA
jgi:hypothetical protein